MFKFSSLWLQPLSVSSFLKPSYTLRLVLLTHQYSANIKGVMFAEYCCELCEAARLPGQQILGSHLLGHILSVYY